MQCQLNDGFLRAPTERCKYPKFTTYIFHSLHGQRLGLQFFILFLQTVREADSFTSFGACDKFLSLRMLKIQFHIVGFVFCGFPK